MGRDLQGYVDFKFQSLPFTSEDKTESALFCLVTALRTKMYTRMVASVSNPQNLAGTDRRKGITLRPAWATEYAISQSELQSDPFIKHKSRV